MTDTAPAPTTAAERYAIAEEWGWGVRLRVRDLLDARQLAYDDVNRRANLPTRTVGHIISGRLRRIYPSRLWPMCQVMRVRYEDVLFGWGDGPMPEPIPASAPLRTLGPSLHVVEDRARKLVRSIANERSAAALAVDAWGSRSHRSSVTRIVSGDFGLDLVRLHVIAQVADRPLSDFLFLPTAEASR